MWNRRSANIKQQPSSLLVARYLFPRLPATTRNALWRYAAVYSVVASLSSDCEKCRGLVFSFSVPKCRRGKQLLWVLGTWSQSCGIKVLQNRLSAFSCFPLVTLAILSVSLKFRLVNVVSEVRSFSWPGSSLQGCATAGRQERALGLLDTQPLCGAFPGSFGSGRVPWFCCLISVPNRKIFVLQQPASFCVARSASFLYLSVSLVSRPGKVVNSGVFVSCWQFGGFQGGFRKSEDEIARRGRLTRSCVVAVPVSASGYEECCGVVLFQASKRHTATVVPEFCVA